MNINIVTLFPNMFAGPFDESMIKRAQEKNIASIAIHNLRDWGIDTRGSVDDHPYGGGPGMLLRVEPLFDAVKEIKSPNNKNTRVVLLDAGGTRFTQQKAVEYSKLDQLILLCGHYEGVDYRVHKYIADDVVSIGDFVLTGGELPAMVITDSVVRLLPGVLNKKGATESESFSLYSNNQQPYVEYPQYTRPETYYGHIVPDVLLSGNHKDIEDWRKKEAIKRTQKNRPDLV